MQSENVVVTSGDLEARRRDGRVYARIPLRSIRTISVGKMRAPGHVASVFWAFLPAMIMQQLLKAAPNDLPDLAMAGVKLGEALCGFTYLMVLIIFAVRALRRRPCLLVQLDNDRKQIVLERTIDLSALTNMLVGRGLPAKST